MRNLKRALSLTLASVMLLGMMVVGSSAAGFPDVDSNDNVEAIEVLNAVEVILGYDNGNFGPDDPVTRAQMAVVMAKLLNLDYQYYEASCPFTDVPAWARGYVGACYAKGIVSGYNATTYGYNDGITPVQAASMMMRALGYFQYSEDFKAGFELATVSQGTDIGIFNGIGSSATAQMTRNQVARMALNALRSNVVTFTGTPGMEVNGVTVGYRPEYTERTSPETKYNAITSLVSDLAQSNQYYIQLGEQLYDGELRLSDNDIDVFGRPARTWEYKGKQIGTYVKEELLRESYSDKVTGKMLYELLSKNTVDTYDFDISVDGEVASTVLGSAFFSKSDLTRANTDAVGGTGKGVTTEVYVDTTNEQVYISVINTYLAKAQEDYNTRDEDVDLAVYKIDNVGSLTNPQYVKTAGVDETITVDVEDFAIENVKKDNLFLVNVAQGEIQVMDEPEILSSVIIDAFKLNSYVTTGGTQYDHADTARYNWLVLDNYDVSNLKELTYNVILDQYGYLIGLERNEDPDQYVFLAGVDGASSNLSAKNVDANIIHLDGTMETVKVDLDKSRNSAGLGLLANYAGVRNLSQLNTWCRYTVSNSGVYTLKEVAIATIADPTNNTTVKSAQYAQDVDVADTFYRDSSTPNVKSINEKRPSLVGWDADGSGVVGGVGYVYGNDDTVYINVSLKDVTVSDNTGYSRNRRIIDDVESVTTGLKNVSLRMESLTNSAAGYLPPAAEIYTLYDNNGIVIAALTIGEDEGTAASFAYIYSSTVNREAFGHTTSGRDGVEGKWTWTREAIIDGVKSELTEVGDSLDVLDTLKQGEWYEIKYDADGRVRKAEEIGDGNAFNASYHYTTNGKYINSVGYVEAAMNNNNTTVLLHDTTNARVLHRENGTLYITQGNYTGFSVSTEVKVVINLADSAATPKEFDKTTDGYTGYTGLDQAIRDLNCRGTAASNGDVEVSALIVNGRAQVIVFNDKTRAGSSIHTPGAASGMGVTVDNNNQIITANFVKGTSVMAKYTAIKAAMPANTFVEYPAMTYALVNNSVMYPIVATDYHSITVDGTPVEYIPCSGTCGSDVAVKGVNLTAYTNGKGYIMARSNTPNQFTTYTYAPYGVAVAPGANFSAGDHVDIKTGYVGTVTSATANAGATVTLSNGTAAYVPVGSNITVSIAYPANTFTGTNQTVTLKYTDGTGSHDVDGSYTLDDAKGGVATFTIPNVKDTITAIAATETAVVNPTALTVSVATPATVDGLTVAVVSAPAQAKAGETVTVTISLAGAAATTGKTITLSAVGSNQPNWLDTQLPAGFVKTSGQLLTADTQPNYGTETVTASFTYTVTGTAADDTITITLADKA